MDHVDQALYTRLNLSGGTKRSALKTALIGIALAALAFLQALPLPRACSRREQLTSSKW